MSVEPLTWHPHGPKVAAAVEELHRAENDLFGSLIGLSDQHKADAEIFHVARDIARWSREHIRQLSEVGHLYDLDLPSEPASEGRLVAAVKQRMSELTSRFHEPSLLLLAQLRQLHESAAGVELDWDVLAQTAQALRDSRLLAVAEECRPHTERQLKWARSKIKETAAQTMVSA